MSPGYKPDSYLVVKVSVYGLTPVALLLTWINFNPSMDKLFGPL